MNKDISSFSKEELLEYIEILENEKKKEAEVYSALESEYENTIDKLNKELLNARGKIISQDITLASYKEKIGVPLIVEGEEIDLYEGEQKDFIINIIKNYMNGLEVYSRSYKICESILNANHKVGTREEIQKVIYQALKGYNGMDKEIISLLNSIGVSVVDDNSGHYRLVFFSDDRYSIYISHSPSEPKCGLNAITDINRLIF